MPYNAPWSCSSHFSVSGASAGFNGPFNAVALKREIMRRKWTLDYAGCSSQNGVKSDGRLKKKTQILHCPCLVKWEVLVLRLNNIRIEPAIATDLCTLPEESKSLWQATTTRQSFHPPGSVSAGYKKVAKEHLHETNLKIKKKSVGTITDQLSAAPCVSVNGGLHCLTTKHFYKFQHLFFEKHWYGWYAGNPHSWQPFGAADKHALIYISIPLAGTKHWISGDTVQAPKTLCMSDSISFSIYRCSVCFSQKGESVYTIVVGKANHWTILFSWAVVRGGHGS